MTSEPLETARHGRFTVSIPAWSLAEDSRVLRHGDTYECWLVLVEAEREPRPAERLQRVRGIATPLPEWPGGLLARHPVRVEADGAVLYWDSPAPVAGPVDVEGWIEANLIDAPLGFPMTHGAVRRIRLEWCDVRTGPRERVVLTERAGYDEVETSQVWSFDGNRDGPVLTAVLVELEISQHSDCVIAPSRRTSPAP